MKRRNKLFAVLTAALLAVGMLPVALSATDSSDWVTGNGYGSIQANEDGTYTFTGDPELNSDNSHCGPYTKANAGNIADGETVDTVDVAIDPAMAAGEKFAVTVSMNDAQGQYKTEFLVLFQGNGTSVGVTAGMAPSFQGVVTEAGIYTLQYRYFDKEGQLYAEFSLLKDGQTVATTGDVDMKVATADCGTRGYIWFSDISVSGGLKVGQPVPNVVLTDCGPWGDTWKNAYNLGWKYVGGFDTTSITSIKVGMKDADGKVILEYTADQEQLAWQAANGYITADGLSSAPFYQVTPSGDEIVEGEDLDWTVVKGEAFAAWQPATFYAEVVTPDKTYSFAEAYDGAYAEPFVCKHDSEKVIVVARVEPTCTEFGNIQYWFCDNCKQFFADAECTKVITFGDTLLEPLNHDVEKVEAKDATETEDGNIEYWYCKTCGKYFADEALTKEITKEDTVVKATGDSNVPETGDNSSLVLFGALLVLSAGAITGLSLRKRNTK